MIARLDNGSMCIVLPSTYMPSDSPQAGPHLARSVPQESASAARQALKSLIS